MTITNTLILRPLSPNDAEMTLAWRNRDDVRNSMFNTDIVEHDQHANWIERVLRDPLKVYLVYERNDLPLGVVGLTFHDNKMTEAEWSFHIGAVLAPTGSGGQMLKLALRHFFEQLKGGILHAEVIENNKASLRLHEKLGFVYKGVQTNSILHDGRQKLVHLFEMDTTTWRDSNEFITSKGR